MEKNITIEEKALEVYPIEEYVSYQIDGVIDKNETKRKCFIEGAKWAIDKACEYLRREYEDIGIRYVRGGNIEEEIEELRKFLEE